jgi:hypothetical protein
MYTRFLFRIRAQLQSYRQALYFCYLSSTLVGGDLFLDFFSSLSTPEGFALRFQQPLNNYRDREVPRFSAAEPLTFLTP